MSTPYRVLYIQERMWVRNYSRLFLFQSFLSFAGLHKYSEYVYEACLRSFCQLPVAALVDGKFFCVHGGISPQLVTLNDLNMVRPSLIYFSISLTARSWTECKNLDHTDSCVISYGPIQYRTSVMKRNHNPTVPLAWIGERHLRTMLQEDVHFSIRECFLLSDNGILF